MLERALHPILELGQPIPSAPHAVSVAMPRWRDVLAYEEGCPQTHARLQSGYPRFFRHPAVAELSRWLGDALGDPSLEAIPFPSRAAAERCLSFLAERTGAPGRLLTAWGGAAAVVAIPARCSEDAWQYWQHTGELVSSRMASTWLAGRCDPRGTAADKEIKTALRRRIAGLIGGDAAHVWLFPTGMAGLARIHRAVTALRPGKPTAQFGFPYLDALKLQQRFGSGVRFFPKANADERAALSRLAARGGLAGAFTECPGNPLMQTPDLPALHAGLSAQGTPLIVDNTLDGCVNLETAPYADAIVLSLTKYFSGKGDVMGGAVWLNPDSPWFGPFTEWFERTREDLLFTDDAAALEINSRDYSARMARVNDTARQLAAELDRHPAVARIYMPGGAAYESMRRPDSTGRGGLFSMTLKDPELRVPAFYDRLPLCKGPSLGTNLTLVCPYAMLAHYDELDWVEAQGVSRWLIRVSVGLEDIDTLKEAFGQALEPRRRETAAAVG